MTLGLLVVTTTWQTSSSERMKWQLLTHFIPGYILVSCISFCNLKGLLPPIMNFISLKSLRSTYSHTLKHLQISQGNVSYTCITQVGNF